MDVHPPERMLFIGTDHSHIPIGNEMWTGKWPKAGGSNKNIIWTWGIVKRDYQMVSKIADHGCVLK